MTMPRTRLVMGNWKMHGNLADNAKLLAGFRAGAGSIASGTQLAVCVPFPYLAQAGEALTGSAVAWGAQDISAQAHGAFTGEVSGAMLKDFACRYALVGHSERRSLHGESDQLVADKAKAALASGLTPVVGARRGRGDCAWFHTSRDGDGSGGVYLVSRPELMG